MILFGFHLFGVGTGWDMAFLTYPVDQVGPVGVLSVFGVLGGLGCLRRLQNGKWAKWRLVSTTYTASRYILYRINKKGYKAIAQKNSKNPRDVALKQQKCCVVCPQHFWGRRVSRKSVICSISCKLEISSRY